MKKQTAKKPKANPVAKNDSVRWRRIHEVLGSTDEASAYRIAGVPVGDLARLNEVVGV